VFNILPTLLGMLQAPRSFHHGLFSLYIK
jgi:hypothetical protein